MILVECSQYSPEWYNARIGVATASQFHRIITPKTMQFSAQAESYANTLVGELMAKESLDSGIVTKAMDRGSILEAEAGEAYEFITGDKLLRAGFILTDNKRYGCSLDRLVEGKSEGVEIKCENGGICMDYFFGKINLADEHKPQVQGQLFVGELDAINTFPYYPGLPQKPIKVGRDEKFIKALEGHLEHFSEMMNKKIEYCVAEGYMTI